MTPLFGTIQWIFREDRMPENALAALTQVAAVGAMTLVTAMTVDVWREVRDRVVELLGRGDRRREALQRQILEESRQHIRSAPPEREPAARASEQGRWEAALRLAFVLDHKLALDLAVLVDDLTARLDSPGHPARAVDDLAAALRARLVVVAERTDPDVRP
jgi:hypothetical protein